VQGVSNVIFRESTKQVSERMEEGLLEEVLCKKKWLSKWVENYQVEDLEASAPYRDNVLYPV